MDLSILYEDDDLIFVDKPAGLVVQRGYDADEPVLIELINEYLQPKNERAFLMQRLDRGTSGVIFFTKAGKLNRNITRQFEEKRIQKTYLALCEGRLTQPELIDAPLKRIGPISFGVREGGQRALTEVRPVAFGDGGSLVRLELLTGRTHQIRVHLAAIGHPLVGDWLYGKRNAPRPMLHAQELRMSHPRGGAALRVTSPTPPDFEAEARRRGINEMGGPLAKENGTKGKDSK